MTDRIAFLIDQNMQQPVHLSIYRAKYFTLSMKETIGEPLVLRWAKAMVSVMENIPITILPQELIVGRLSGVGKYGIFYPELDASLFANQELEKSFEGAEHLPYSKKDYTVIMEEILPFWKGNTFREEFYPLLPKATKKIMFSDSENSEPRFIISETATIRHSLQWALDYKKILEIGFVGIEKDAQAHLDNLSQESNNTDESKKNLYESVIILCQGIKTFAERYAQKALELAKNSNDINRQKELYAIAERCNHVPYHPARNFIEAVQAQWFAQLISRIEQSHGGHISNGRIDQFLYPFYTKDKTENDITDEQTKEILQCLWLNIAQCVRLNPTPVGSKMYQDYLHWEFTTIAGQLSDGSDATNKLTTLVLDSVLDFPLDFPWLGIRIHKNSPKVFLEYLCDKLVNSHKSPVLLNDEEIIPLLIKRGGTLEEALDYCGSGFSEARMINKDTYFTGTTWINLLAVLEMALYNGATSASKMETVGLTTGNYDEFSTFSQLWESLLLQLNFLLSRVAEQQDLADSIRKNYFSAPYLSSLHDLAMRDGKDVTQGGFSELQSGGNIGAIGFANLVDSLAVIQELVFEKKKYTLSELLKVVRNNFEKNESIREECLQVCKFGTVNERTDKLAYALDSAMVNFCQNHKDSNGKNPMLFYVPVAAHLAMGRVTGATPDGRLAGQAFNYGFSPVKQDDFPTPSLVLTSLKNSKDNTLMARGARVLYLDLPAYIYRTTNGKSALYKILQTWCKQKHWFLQLHFCEEHNHHNNILPSMQKHGLNTNYLRAL